MPQGMRYEGRLSRLRFDVSLIKNRSGWRFFVVEVKIPACLI